MTESDSEANLARLAISPCELRKIISFIKEHDSVNWNAK